MKGTGTAYAGITILNAIGTGIGGALGIELPLTAEARPSKGVSGWSNHYGSIDPRILDAVRTVAAEVGAEAGFHVRVHSLIPPSRGLKSSSALVNAMLEAVLDMSGVKVEAQALAKMGVKAAKIAGITVTGAYDDSLASKVPGAHITDNIRVETLRTYPAPKVPVVVLVPEKENPIQGVDPSSFKKYKDLYMKAVKVALDGNWLEAIPLNSMATMRATGTWDMWGLVEEALSMDCTWTAGMSGKGPALFALTSCPSRLASSWRRVGDVIVTTTLG